jgi:hypothetical protein
LFICYIVVFISSDDYGSIKINKVSKPDGISVAFETSFHQTNKQNKQQQQKTKKTNRKKNEKQQNNAKIKSSLKKKSKTGFPQHRRLILYGN